MGNYGLVVTEKDVTDAARATAQAWTATYVAEIGRRKGVTLQPVRKYGTSLATTDTDTEYPAMAFSCPGLYGDPERQGRGMYEAPFALGVGVVVAAPDKDSSLDLAAFYGAAVTEMFVQQGALGGFAVETVWMDRETVPIGFELDRWMSASTNMFVVRVGNVVSRFGGPLTPPSNPATVPSDPSTVTTVDVTTSRI